MRTCATGAKEENSDRAHCAADGKCFLNEEGESDSARRHLIAGELVFTSDGVRVGVASKVVRALIT